ncbi:hypothetical protein Tco_0016678 [Tanacetum coccineum]
MPSTPGGIESSCSRNASISSIRKVNSSEGVKDGRSENHIISCEEGTVEGLPLSEISRHVPYYEGLPMIRSPRIRQRYQTTQKRQKEEPTNFTETSLGDAALE